MEGYKPNRKPLTGACHDSLFGLVFVLEPLLLPAVMSAVRISATICLIIVLCSSTTAAGAKAPSSKSSTGTTKRNDANPESLAWRIDYLPGQTSAASTVFLTKDSVRINTDGSYEITAHAPEWSATVVNKKMKFSCELPAARWMKDGFFLDRPDAKEYMNPKDAASEEKVNFRGLQATRRKWDTLESDQFYRYRVEPQKCVIELITTDGAIPATKMQLELLSAWYGIPSLKGVPLFWQNILPKEKSLRLRVSNVSRVPVNSISFKVMPGCTKQTSMMKLVDNKYSNAMTDFIEFEQDIVEEKKGTKPPLKDGKIPATAKVNKTTTNSKNTK
jgi:hypothetical protein